MSEKIGARHLDRAAILYIRQSTPYQIVHNDESRRLQYAMEARLQQLGWNEVAVIDEDTGLSAADTMTRSGFEHMVAQVCLGKVGAVAARELSRFARNSRDWQQLLEVCRVVDTLLIDHETVYDVRRSNDRLLLGLKGSLNEYELELLRLRSWDARMEKARRGELIVTPPIGFIKTVEKRLEKDPDLRVQGALQMVFAKFLELGSVRRVLMWYQEESLTLPVRRYGAEGWETVWKRPSYNRVESILTNPIYAGAYAFGKNEVVTQYRDGVAHKRSRRRSTDRWLVLIPNHHDGYIAWEQFQQIQSMIGSNAQGSFATAPGAARRGPALLYPVSEVHLPGRPGRR